MDSLNHSKLYLQDPTDGDSYSLHEALLSVCGESQLGGGMFSFVTQSGVQLLLEDEAFLNFMERAPFELIVGIDEITNPRALSRLKALSVNRTNFNVSAFLHEGQRPLFHPKFCWFKTESGGKLVIGSGNLTFGGLRNNWEAYSIVDLSAEELSAVEALWAQWLTLHAAELKPVDDTKVLEKAKLNVWKRKVAVAENTEAVEQSPEDERELEETLEQREDIDDWEFKDSDEVLIAEIPKSGDRWSQANFDKRSFEDFFDAELGNNNQRVLLRNVSSEGVLGDVESRPSVSVVSKNYRFELGAAAGLDYPKENAPVGIFIKIAKRVFLYCLVMPDDVAYPDIQEQLTTRWSSIGGRAGQMKRVALPLAELKNSVKDLSFWRIHQD